MIFWEERDSAVFADLSLLTSKRIYVRSTQEHYCICIEPPNQTEECASRFPEKEKPANSPDAANKIVPKSNNLQSSPQASLALFDFLVPHPPFCNLVAP